MFMQSYRREYKTPSPSLRMEFSEYVEAIRADPLMAKHEGPPGVGVHHVGGNGNCPTEEGLAKLVFSYKGLL
jgi:hypothetical protein